MACLSSCECGGLSTTNIVFYSYMICSCFRLVSTLIPFSPYIFFRLLHPSSSFKVKTCFLFDTSTEIR
ncbi:hypothetical protein VNO80_20509 [Phaseolus coccineus]|uniref:Uncharacterized protein n=1 Tax=Phaseolus coccineus TaxID=3886 RepID=A0AAN9QT83_PHACN